MGSDQTFRPLVGKPREVLDRFGHVIAPGDMLMIPALGDVVWHVAKVAAVLDPQAPPGLVQMVLTAGHRAVVQAGERTTEFIKVLDVSERPEGERPPT